MDSRDDVTKTTVNHVRRNYTLHYNPHGGTVWVQPKKRGDFQGYTVTKEEAIAKLQMEALLSIEDQLLFSEILEEIRAGEKPFPRNEDLDHFQKIDF